MFTQQQGAFYIETSPVFLYPCSSPAISRRPEVRPLVSPMRRSSRPPGHHVPGRLLPDPILHQFGGVFRDRSHFRAIHTGKCIRKQLKRLSLEENLSECRVCWSELSKED